MVLSVLALSGTKGIVPRSPRLAFFSVSINSVSDVLHVAWPCFASRRLSHVSPLSVVNNVTFSSFSLHREPPQYERASRSLPNTAAVRVQACQHSAALVVSSTHRTPPSANCSIEHLDANASPVRCCYHRLAPSA